ncbi:hypothetical protein FB451DRAFT_1384363 [Mycena latifolia]|nr:hypothetical protein FB451DRAFT_1384363 [Mycena latifolia]
MSISTRTTRSGGQLKSAAQAKEDGRYQEHLKCSSVLPSTEFPTLRMYCQLDGRDRIRVDNDVAYASILNLARTMLNHLVGSSIAQRELVAVVDLISHSPAAKAALASKLGEDRKVTAADIIDFLVNHTPAVVFKLLQGKEDSNAVVWGLVVKGDAEGAKDNEIFISLELTEALRLVVVGIFLVSTVRLSSLMHHA